MKLLEIISALKAFLPILKELWPLIQKAIAAWNALSSEEKQKITAEVQSLTAEVEQLVKE